MKDIPFYPGGILPGFEDEVIQDITKVTKRCTVCNEEKPLEEFHQNNTGRTKNYGSDYPRYRNVCKDCRSKSGKKDSQKSGRLMKKSGKIRPALGTPCECCEDKGKILFFDHCHKTDEFRGWICNTCNTAIAMLGDDIEGIKRALRYLTKK